MSKFINYYRKLHLLSITERLFVLLYSVFMVLLDRLPKNPINAHNLFNELQLKGINVYRKGPGNIVLWNNNQSDFKIYLKRDSSDPLVFKQVFFDNEYLPVINLFAENHFPLERMIDAGANIGLASLFIKQFFPDVQIVALEPNKETFQRLKINIDTNQLKGIQPLAIGLWNSDTHVSGSHSFRDKKDWSFRLVESSDNSGQNFSVRSVDSLMTSLNWPSIDLLKIDIEGGEDAVFKSAEIVENWLPKIRVIAIEIHDEFNCRKRIYDILTLFGFELIVTGELTIALNKKFVTL